MRVVLAAMAAVLASIGAGCSWPLAGASDAGGGWAPAPEGQVVYVDDDAAWVAPLDGQGPPRRVVAGGSSAALSPDGRLLAALERNGIVLADVASGRVVLRRVLEPLLRPVWSPDGARVAVGVADGVLVLEVATGSITRLAVPVGDDLVSVTWAPDGRSIAVHHGQILDAMPLDGGAPTRIAELEGFAGPLWGPPGIAYADRGRLWLVSRPGDAPRTLDVESPGRWKGSWSPVDWSAAGDRLLLTTGCVHSCVEGAVLELDTGRLIRLGHTSPVALSRDGRRALLQADCASGLGGVELLPLRVVDLDGGGTRTLPFQPTACGATWSVAVGSDGLDPRPRLEAPAPERQVASLDRAGAVVIGYLDRRAEPRTLPLQGATPPMLSPDGRDVAVALDGAVVVVDVATGVEQRRIPLGQEVVALDWSPDARQLVVEWRGRLDLVALDGGAPVRLGAGSAPRWGRRGIAFGDGGRIRLVEPPDGAVRDVVLPDDAGPGWSPVDWSADGRRLLVARFCWHGCTEAAVLDVETGSFRRLGSTTPMALSADGRTALVQDGCDSGIEQIEPEFPLRAIDTTLAGDGGVVALRPGRCGASWSPAPPP